jgi:dTDP-4-dehydrorhamnose reductase
LDLTDSDAIRRVVREWQPQLIVNAAAYTAVDQAENDRQVAHAVNAVAPRVMAEEARKVGAAIVHYSTDYVFDGCKSTPYQESDVPSPINFYGKTKLAGEEAIERAGVPYIILRTAWVYATQGNNFLLSILRLASQKEELRVVEDQIGAPTWSRMIAIGTTCILARMCSSEFGLSGARELSGVYHLTAAGQTSWYDFARAILEECSNSAQLGPWFAAATGGQPFVLRRIVPISSNDYLSLARRPAYSVLSNNKLRHRFGIILPHWRSQLHLALIKANTNNGREISVANVSERSKRTATYNR